MPDAILTRIDATVEGRCACGCGTRLDPDGPSAWFAGERCQRRYQQAQATNPGDVLDRPETGLAHDLLHVLLVVWCPACRRGTDLPAGDRTVYPCCGTPLPDLTGTVERAEGSDGWWLTIESPDVGATRTFLPVERAVALGRHEWRYELRRMWLRLQCDLIGDGRVPYELLAEEERAPIHAWVDAHSVDHRLVPVDAVIEHDPTFGEWRIERFALRDGQPYIDPKQPDEIATIIVRRREKSPLPWPVARGPERRR